MGWIDDEELGTGREGGTSQGRECIGYIFVVIKYPDKSN